MKVMQINCVYKNGSTGKIVSDIHNQLKENKIESIICYGRGKLIKEKNVYKTSSEILAKFNNIKSRLTGLQYNGSFFSTKNIIKIINKEKPTVIHLHCINGFFVNIFYLIDYLKRNNYKVIITLHAEFLYTANCGHSLDCEKWKFGCGKCPQLKEATNSYLLDRTSESWKKMYDSFKDFENLTIISVSPWLQSRAEKSPILQNKKHFTILNGIDTKNIFFPQNVDRLRKKYQSKNEKIILHVTSNFISEFKGGKYIIELANRLQDQNIKILVVGNLDKTIVFPSNIVDIGRIENQNQLAEYYSLADLTIITSKKETFSMVCAESLACGTPVVGFKAGAPEQISLSEYSQFVSYGSMEELENTVLKWINLKKILNPQLFTIASNYYSKERMYEEYLKLYEEA